MRPAATVVAATLAAATAGMLALGVDLPAGAQAPVPTAEPAPQPGGPTASGLGAALVQLPQLARRGRAALCTPGLRIQNMGAQASVAAVVLWDVPAREPGTVVPAGACAVESAPIGVRCVGPIVGGAAHQVGPAELGAAGSGAVYSLGTRPVRELGLDREGTVADYVCERLQATVLGDSAAWLAFRRAYEDGAGWQSLASLGGARGGRLAIEVERACHWPAEGAAETRIGLATYDGLPSDLLGSYDSEAGRYVYLAPLVHSDAPTLTTSIHVQNAARDPECATVDVELVPPRTDCPDGPAAPAGSEGDPTCRLRLQIAPGSSATVDAAADMPGCLGAGENARRGAARISGSRPLAVVVDSAGPDAFTSYVAEPAWVEPPLAEMAYDGRELAAFAPLVYAGVEAAAGAPGWSTRLHVMSQGPKSALVRLELFDPNGTRRKSLDEWVCPGTSAVIDLGSMADLPRDWLGLARLRSMERSLGITGPEEVPSIVAVAESLRLAADGAPSEAHAYNLLPESRAFEWPQGHFRGGLDSGTGLIAMPRLELGASEHPDGSRLAVANVVSDPGSTDYVVQLYDRNGLYDFECRRSRENAVEYLDTRQSWLVGPGTVASAVVSAVYWEHQLLGPDPAGGSPRRLLGLAAVAARQPYFSSGGPFALPAGDGDLPGDASVASAGAPLRPGPGADAAAALDQPSCPGGHPQPWQTQAPLETGTAGPGATSTIAAPPSTTPRLDPRLAERAWLPLVLGAARLPPASATPRDVSPTRVDTPAGTQTVDPPSTVVPSPSTGPTPTAEAAVPVWVPLLNGAERTSELVVQSVGGEPSRILMVQWAEPSDGSSAGAADPGPLAVVCSGLLGPGTSWRFGVPDLPPQVRSAALFSFSARALSELGVEPRLDEPAADWICRTMAEQLPGSAAAYATFLRAYVGGSLPGLAMARLRGAPLAAEVTGERVHAAGASAIERASFNALSNAELGTPVGASGEHVYYAPLAPAGPAPSDTIVHVQNAGAEPAAFRIVFGDRDDCDRPVACPPRSVTPGRSVTAVVSECAEGRIGSLTLRSDQPLAIVVEVVDRDTRSQYTATAGPALPDASATLPSATMGRVLYGPLVYYGHDWSSSAIVQNASDDAGATVRVTWIDRAGEVVAVDQGTICPGGSRAFEAPAGDSAAPWYVGNLRVESLPVDPAAPDQPVPPVPIAGVLHATRYRLPERAQPLGASAYNLLGEAEALLWPTAGVGGTASGVAALAVPSLTSALADASAEGSHVDTLLAITNLVDRPGFTDFVIYVYDRNGLLDYVCQKLNERQTEYVDLATWGYVNPGFEGSALVSAMFWEHEIFDASGRYVRNLVGLGGVVGGRRDAPADGAVSDTLCATDLAALSPAAVAAIAPPFPLACFSGPRPIRR